MNLKQQKYEQSVNPGKGRPAFRQGFPRYFFSRSFFCLPLISRSLIFTIPVRASELRIASSKPPMLLGAYFSQIRRRAWIFFRVVRHGFRPPESDNALVRRRKLLGDRHDAARAYEADIRLVLHTFELIACWCAVEIDRIPHGGGRYGHRVGLPSGSAIESTAYSQASSTLRASSSVIARSFRLISRIVFPPFAF